jgi:hypothetical protein
MPGNSNGGDVRRELEDPNIVNPKQPKRIAVVISNPAVFTATGWPVGLQPLSSIPMVTTSKR